MGKPAFIVAAVTAVTAVTVVVGAMALSACGATGDSAANESAGVVAPIGVASTLRGSLPLA